MKPVRIIIFAKAPRPGFAKTRLIPALGAAGAAALARQMLDDTLAAALGAVLGTVELCVTPHPLSSSWRALELPPGIELTAQGDGDLGLRMFRAARRAARRGEAALLIGTDCVGMDPALLRGAADALREADAVIHPSSDGGYVLLGLARFSPRLFDGIAWSTDGVAATTTARIRALGWSLHVGATMHDVDVADDLRHLAAQSSESDSEAARKLREVRPFRANTGGV